MFRIKVERLVAKDIKTVFAALTDHDNFKQFPGVDDSIVLEAGKEARNGVGALRKIVAGPVTLFERIEGYENPVSMHYRIEKSTPIPMRHDTGQIILMQTDGKTSVSWISEGRMRIPFVGVLIDKIVERRITKVFNAILRHIETM